MARKSASQSASQSVGQLVDQPVYQPKTNKKRTYEEVINGITLKKTNEIQFEAFNTGTPREAEVILPSIFQDHVPSPCQLFTLLWPEFIWDIIANNTNLYTQAHLDSNKTQRSWHPTTAAEIRVFMGIIIYMGTIPAVRIENY